MNHDGSEREIIARYQQGPVDIDVDDRAIYWINNFTDEVRMLEKSEIGGYDPARAVEED